MPSGLDLLFLVPGMEFDGSTLETRSLGGSETAGAYLARALAARGHRTVVFSNCPRPGLYDGVVYRPVSEWAEYASNIPHDAAIIQRLPQGFSSRLAARLNVLWCHDLALRRSARDVGGVAWNIDVTVTVSKWMREQYLSVYNLRPEDVWASRNGVDLSAFPAAPLLRDPYQLIFSARPERGLDVLLTRVMPRILAEEPRARLAVYGYDNRPAHLEAFYNQCRAYAEALGPGIVEWGGHLPKRQLYQRYARGGLYVYPTPSPIAPTFREVSCISVMEAQAAGLPVVSTATGALPETLSSGAGTLIPTTESSWPEAMAAEVVRLIRDEDSRAAMSRAGLVAAQSLGWDGVAEDWEREIITRIEARNDSPARLAYHFLHHSDVFAAEALLPRLDETTRAEVQAVLDTHYPWRTSETATREHYRRQHEDCYGPLIQGRIDRGEITRANFDSTSEARFPWIESELRRVNARRVLDWGSSYGWMAVWLNRRLGIEIDCVDTTPGIKGIFDQLRQHAAMPEALRFFVPENLPGGGGYDAVIVSEVLEHLLNPEAVLRMLERLVRPGGVVILTVPYGAGESEDYSTLPFRSHLWHFDPHDVHDMVGHKRGFRFVGIPHRFHNLTREPMGYWAVSYRVEPEDAPARDIDMSRHLRLQRPRQTLSAILMAGAGAVDTLSWCLRAMEGLPNEIIIADSGLTEEGLAIARRYGAHLFPAPSPVVEGFEVPRNLALARARMDWVMWVDTDEQLEGRNDVFKYLRANRFAGYGVRQHHYSLDANFPPDMPVRIFRRDPEMRFYGIIHEHPERGLNKGPGEVIVLADVNLSHVGYVTEARRRERFSRNLPLLARDRERYPDRQLQKHFIIRDLILMCSHELQANGGRPTDLIFQRCEEVIRLWREHFRGKPAPINVNSLEYYSQALVWLGRGVDVALSVRASRDGQGDNLALPPERYRFETAEDIQAELAARVEAGVLPLLGEDW